MRRLLIIALCGNCIVLGACAAPFTFKSTWATSEADAWRPSMLTYVHDQRTKAGALFVRCINGQVRVGVDAGSRLVETWPASVPSGREVKVERLFDERAGWQEERYEASTVDSEFLLPADESSLADLDKYALIGFRTKIPGKSVRLTFETDGLSRERSRVAGQCR